MTGRLSTHNLVATFPDMDKARQALLGLGRAGIEADRISLLGRSVEEVASDPDTRLRDLEVTGAVAKEAAATGAAGGVLGGLAGAAAFVIPGVGPAVGAGIWAAVAAGAVGGGAVGGMVGGVASIDLNEEWELTFQDALRDGKVVVAVHADDDEGADKARRALEDEGADSLEHLDADGRPVDPG